MGNVSVNERLRFCVRKTMVMEDWREREKFGRYFPAKYEEREEMRDRGWRVEVVGGEERKREGERGKVDLKMGSIKGESKKK